MLCTLALLACAREVPQQAPALLHVSQGEPTMETRSVTPAASPEEQEPPPANASLSLSTSANGQVQALSLLVQWGESIWYWSEPFSPSSPEVHRITGTGRAHFLDRHCLIDETGRYGCIRLDESDGVARPIFTPWSDDGWNGAKSLAVHYEQGAMFRIDENHALQKGLYDPPLLPAVEQFCAHDERRACAVQSDGGVACVRHDSDSQPTRFQVPALEDATQVACSALSLCARLNDGTISCLGDVVGDPIHHHGLAYRHLPQTSATAIAGVEGAVDLVGYHQMFCAVVPSEGLLCWGQGVGLEQIDRPLGIPRTTPFVIPFAHAHRVAIDGDAVCALGTNATVECWARNPSWHHHGEPIHVRLEILQR